jgi:hypothetical protein
MKIKNAKDFWAGLMFLAVGLGFVLVARNYSMGTAVRMGPAYFPTVLGGILAVLGATIFLRSFVIHAEKVGAFHLKPLVIVLVAIILFALTLKPLGLVIATLIVVGIGAFASHEFSWKATIVLAVILAAFAVVVFYYGLGLPFNIWPEFLG